MVINVNNEGRRIELIDNVVYRLLVPFHCAVERFDQGHRGPLQHVPDSLSVVRHDDSCRTDKRQYRRVSRFAVN